MDAYAHLLEQGDTGTAIITGTLARPLSQWGTYQSAVMDVGTGRYINLLLPDHPGARLVAGDLMPTLVDALRDAIEHLGSGGHGRDPEWVAPEVLDRLERYERALDALRGGFFDEEKTAGCDCV